MDVFDLDEAVIDRYKAFARSFADIRSPELNAKVDELYATRRCWPESPFRLNPHYAGRGSIRDFISCIILLCIIGGVSKMLWGVRRGLRYGGAPTRPAFPRA